MRPIDADALKEKAREWIPPYNASVVMNLFDLIDNLVDNLPTIDPVKHGKWIPHEETTELSPGVKMTAKGYICSECGERFGNAWTWCGNCGARMERSEE